MKYPPISIDLFSDTNVNPTPAMRQVMAAAEVGNEVAAEDPTVNALLDAVCKLLDKPAATFMPSGSMCNCVAYRALCQPGERIILDHTSHTLHMTGGMIAGLVGAQPEVIYGQRGMFGISELEKAIGKNTGYNIAKAKLLSIEQTTNLGGGAIWPLKQISMISEFAHNAGLYTHMDGARLLNACVASNTAAATYAQHFDSVWIDFAKGLGAPMGAVIAGSTSFIDKVWHYKFQQGGTMHQAGILAAGCLYALENNVDRLAEDHAHAAQLATLLAEIPHIVIQPNEVQTNIVIFSIECQTMTAFDLVELLRRKGIRLLAIDAKTLRAILHMDISINDIQMVVSALKNIFNNIDT